MMRSFIKAHNKSRRNWSLGLFIAAIILIPSSIPCFFWANDKATKSESETVPLAIDLVIMGTGINFLLASWLLCYMYCCGSANNYVCMLNNIERSILLEGEIWHSQLDSIQNHSLPNTIIARCLGGTYRRLKLRSYGHIVLTREGIAVDELFAIPYEKVIVLGVKILSYNSSTLQTGCILRVNLITRYYVIGGLSKGAPTKFHVDLFMPPSLERQDVTNTAVDNWTSRSGNCSTLWRNGSPHEKSYILRRNG